MRASLWRAVPDIRFTLEQAIAEGEWVAARWAVRGTHRGEFSHPTLGHASATGSPIATTYMDHYRIIGGKIVEGWEVGDRLTLLRQLGAILPSGQQQPGGTFSSGQKPTG